VVGVDDVPPFTNFVRTFVEPAFLKFDSQVFPSPKKELFPKKSLRGCQYFKFLIGPISFMHE
jgi:hypothetical protein